MSWNCPNCNSRRTVQLKVWTSKKPDVRLWFERICLDCDLVYQYSEQLHEPVERCEKCGRPLGDGEHHCDID